MAYILLAEDEINIASFIERGLQESGHTVYTVHDGISAWRAIQQEQYDILILDIIMPQMNGLEVCKKFRQTEGYRTPILLLTALGTSDDIVSGLEAGADDYLVKPFNFQELGARIKALVRRSCNDKSAQTLTCADLILNCNTRKAQRGTREIELTVKEYRLLEYFLQNQGCVLSRMNLLKNVWDKNFDPNTNIVDVYVNYLRAKIDKDFDKKLIHTVMGTGYIMEAH
ncbi:response regulator transcription factor [Coprobacter sp.]|uniref:response regulator transcription factor n=1 Tax=Coprobacter sp. TaxID=1941478 RepID=UPI003AB84290